MGKLLRPAEVARLLDVSDGTVRRWLAEGHLPSIRTPGGQYRIDPESVARLMTMPIAESDETEAVPA
jgi:excisionase family DNA binding protein